MKQGATKAAAEKEVDQSTDLLVYYSGWADKYQQLFSSVNPVASSHFNFSALEPTGVVGVIAPQNSSLIGLVASIIPAITGGNTVVVLASEKQPLCAVTFAEVLHSSDVPGGVVNILTGKESELLEHFGTHMDINAVLYGGGNQKNFIRLKELGTDNVKRVRDFDQSQPENPYLIADFQEVKTTWHPIENIGGSSSTY
jgi:acyl-CoA reductase-like NAD-dependent aldehyde dehydrogenase